MPCLNNAALNAFGAVVGAVGVSDPKRNGTVSADALIDTGAQQSCISTTVAQQLSLVSVGLQPIISATGTQNRNTYIVDFDVHFPARTSTLSGILVIELQIPAAHPQIILGRDVLTRPGASFSLSNSQFTFCL